MGMRLVVQGSQGERENRLADRSEAALVLAAYGHHLATLGDHWVPLVEDHGDLGRDPLAADGIEVLQDAQKDRIVESRLVESGQV